MLRHFEDATLLIIAGMALSITFCGFWYIFQKLYLKSFFRGLDSEKREIQAVKKQEEVTNVLNLQQDAVIIFSGQDDNHAANASVGSYQSQNDVNSLKIEFSNCKSAELLGTDLSQALASENTDEKEFAQSRLILPQFVQIEKQIDAAIYEPETDNESRQLNALRVLMGSEINIENDWSSSVGLISLKDIIFKKEPDVNRRYMHEFYIKLHRGPFLN